jgi:hypothetical protein
MFFVASLIMQFTFLYCYIFVNATMCRYNFVNNN